MKSVFTLAFLLALAEYSLAINVCNQEYSKTSDLIISCTKDNGFVKYPNYDDFETYFSCEFGQQQLHKCPQSQKFCYYRQNCGPCSNFLLPPDCEFFASKMNSKCSKTSPTPTTKAPTTIAPITTAKTTKKNMPTVPTGSTTQRQPSTGNTPAASRKPIPTPPSQSTTTVGIPMPPMVVTPVKGIPTPPNENVTPPSIPGTPPMLTTVQST